MPRRITSLYLLNNLEKLGQLLAVNQAKAILFWLVVAGTLDLGNRRSAKG
jgi:hypothetical protein